MSRRRPRISGLLERSAQFAILLVAILALVLGLQHLSDIAIPVTLGLIFGLALSPSARRLEDLGLPPLLSAGGILLTLIAISYAAAVTLSGPLETWIDQIPEVRTALERQLHALRDIIFQVRQISETTDQVSELAGKEAAQEVVVKEPGMISIAAASAPVMAAQLLIFVATLFFFLANRLRVRDVALSLCVTPHARLTAARIFRDIERAISNYFRTIALINAGLGIATAVMTWMLGLPSPILWGCFAAIANFAPFVGPAVVAVTLAGVGFVTYPELSLAILPAAIFIGFNIVESQFVTPLLLGRHLVINSLVIFLALVFWMWLWGPAGAFVAVPAVVAGFVIAGHLLKGSPVLRL